MAYEFRGPGVNKPPPKKLVRRQPAAPVVSEALAPPPPAPRGGSGRSLVQIFAAVMGLAFLLAGAGGFIPGVTSNYDELSLFGTDSNAELLGLFRVSVLHNIIHLLFAVGLVAAAKASWSKIYLLGGGVVYLGVAVYGFVVEKSSDANFIPINNTDNFLHVGLSSAMIVLGLIGLAIERRKATSS